MIKSCECIIGLRHDYDNTELVNLGELKEHIKTQKQFKENHKDSELWRAITDDFRDVYSLEDYCDRRKNTDLTRFEFCPFCGQKIDWKKIKRSNNNAE